MMKTLIAAVSFIWLAGVAQAADTTAPRPFAPEGVDGSLLAPQDVIKMAAIHNKFLSDGLATEPMTIASEAFQRTIRKIAFDLAEATAELDRGMDSLKAMKGRIEREDPAGYDKDLSALIKLAFRHTPGDAELAPYRGELRAIFQQPTSNDEYARLVLPVIKANVARSQFEYRKELRSILNQLAEQSNNKALKKALLEPGFAWRLDYNRALQMRRPVWAEFDQFITNRMARVPAELAQKYKRLGDSAIYNLADSK